MKYLENLKNGSKQNKVFVVLVLAISLVGIEVTTHFFSNLSGNLPNDLGGGVPVVAVVQTVKLDVRQKPVEEPSWYRAEAQTEIMKGDALYSGRQSHSQVRMKSGGVLELGEETLVIFDDVDGVTIPDVTRGQVKLKVNGEMKIAISGEVTEFTGAQSELVLNADGTRSIRVIRGQANVVRQGLAIKSLVTGQRIDLPPPKPTSRTLPKIDIPKAGDLISEVRISSKRKTADPAVTPLKPIEFSDTATVASTPAPAPAPAAVVPQTVTEVPEPPLAVIPPPSEPAVVKEALSPTDLAQKISGVMKVQEVYKRNGARTLVPRTALKMLKVPVALSWNGAADTDRLVVQVSKDPEFKKPWSEREATGRNAVISEWKPGRNFWRVSRDRVTWTDPAEVIVKPVLAVQQSPEVHALSDKVPVRSEVKLKFQDPNLPKARGWVLQGSNSPVFANGKTKTVYIGESRVDIPLKRPGRYYFRVRSVASAGEISKFSSAVAVEAFVPKVKPPEKKVDQPVPIRLAEKESERKRKVAAVEESPIDTSSVSRQTTKVKTTVSDPVRPRPWKVAIEGGEAALVSSEQLNQDTEPASTHVIGVRAGYDDDIHKANIAYRSKFAGSNSEGNAQANQRFDLGYTRFWQTGWRPLRLGWAGAFTSYRNASGPRFSRAYDAAKTGLDVGIRIGDRWKTGGEALIGTWTDSNRVYEFGGFISYDISRALAFGVGYRLSLFEANTQGSAPVELPFREAMGEAYSSLQFSF